MRTRKKVAGLLRRQYPAFVVSTHLIVSLDRITPIGQPFPNRFNLPMVRVAGSAGQFLIAVKEKGAKPAPSPGWIIIEEDFWAPLVYEPLFSLDSIRMHFVAGVPIKR